MTPNRIALSLAALLFVGTGIVVLQGVPEAAVTPPRPIPTASIPDDEPAPVVATRTPPARPPDVRLDRLDGAIRFAVLEAGGEISGTTAPIQIHLTTWTDGRLVASTLSSGRPITVRPRTHELRPSIDRTVMAMRPGERRLVKLPPGSDDSPGPAGSDDPSEGTVIELAVVTGGSEQ